MEITLPDRAELHVAHQDRLDSVAEEAARLATWAAFRARYAAEIEGAPHGERMALRLKVGAEFGMDERETRRAWYGS